ncbi:hypothetical protein [Aliterella atlantica]|uniref:hypothetical protein n=1 Tax=Aliterella atlantica TaxID=1827278 RepID=UPI0011857A53
MTKHQLIEVSYHDLVFQGLKSLGNHSRQSVVETYLSARSQMLDSIFQPILSTADPFYEMGCL